MTDQVVQGLDEITLRNKLGDAGYESWKRKADALDDLKLLETNAVIEESKARTRAAIGRASLLNMAALAVFCGTVCGVAEFLRWVLR